MRREVYIDKASLIVFYILALLAFLPSITFSVISAEVFPWATVFVLVYARKINWKILLIIIYLLVSTIIVLAIKGNEVLFESVRSLSAYLNSLLIFGVLLSMSSRAIYQYINVIIYLFIFLTFLGLAQLSGILEPFDSTFKFFIPRAFASSLEFMGGRGVTLLSSEPARAGIEYVFIYLVVRTVFIQPKKHILADILVGLFLVVAIKSATVMIFYVIFMAVFYRTKLILLTPVIILIVSIILAFTDLGDSRAFALVQKIDASMDFQDVLYLLSNNSGHRITSIVAAYKYGILNPFGGGVGNWMETSIYALNTSGIDLSKLRYFQLYGDSEAVSIRASGYVSNLIMDVGIVGVGLLFYYLYSAFRPFMDSYKDNLSIITLFIVKILFFGSVGNPVSWAATALCLRYINNKKIQDGMPHGL